jgi:hypothetical protein
MAYCPHPTSRLGQDLLADLVVSNQSPLNSLSYCRREVHLAAKTSLNLVHFTCKRK